MAGLNTTAPPAPQTTRQLTHARQQQELRCRWACRIAGCFFLGIQSGFNLVPDKMLFERVPGRTLAMDVDHVTPLAITYHVLNSEKQFQQKEAA